MKTTYKYIEFVEVAQKPKTKAWTCHNRRSGVALGYIEWYASWRQYVYTDYGPGLAVYSASCLRDIADFLEQVNKEHKERG